MEENGGHALFPGPFLKPFNSTHENRAISTPIRPSKPLNPPNRGYCAAQQLTAVNCALHHSQSSHAKTHPAKFGVFVLPYRQRSQQTETVSNLKDNEVNIVRAYNNWRRYRSTVAELGLLTSRELNDLGISRGDIPFIAKQSAAR
jgi:uncharacterized protein YjiS (DUF1127 family)